jgi:hypothetical protein
MNFNINNADFKKIMNVPFAVIIASFIIIIITTNMTDSNGLSALIGGYFGLLVGILFVLILDLMFTNVRMFDMIPLVIIMGLVGLLIYYLFSNFDRISSGQVSNYYSNFSILSTIFLVFQIVVIINSVFKQDQLSSRLFNDKTMSILGLFGILNLLVVMTLGIVLHFYSTQG